MHEELFFAVGTIGLSKLKAKPSTLLAAARHNLREIHAERGAFGHIDPARTMLNELLAGPGTADGVVDLAKTLMAAAGIDCAKLRRDYTQAVELVFSMPPSCNADEGQFFAQCVAWAAQRFGADSLLSAVLHRDEAAHHCHILVMPPMRDGKMCGNELVTRPATAAMRESFTREVAVKFGLKQTPKLVGELKADAVAMVLDRLRATHDPVLNSALWQNIQDGIERDPAPFMTRLGLAAPTRKLKTMAQIFTGTGKGPRQESKRTSPIGFENEASCPHPIEPRSNTIGFERVHPDSEKATVSACSNAPQVASDNAQKNGTENHQTLSCVGFDDKTTTQRGLIPTTLPKRCKAVADEMSIRALPSAASGYGDPIRVRDCDLPAGAWNPAIGEFALYSGP